MANQWLRLWHDMPTDPKWRTIARVSKQSVSEVIAVFTHLLVCASNATDRGRTQSFNCEDVASALDIQTEQVEAIIAAMQGRVLDDDRLKGWEIRQVAREDGSAERSKAWREAKKVAKTDDSNATERNRTQSKRKQTPDTDTDTDKSNKEANASLRGKKKCPVDFVVTPELAAWAASDAPLVDLALETDKLRDYTFSRAITDWAGAWRNWMRKAQKDAESRPRSAPKQNFESFAERDERRARERIAEATGTTIKPTDMGMVIDITPQRISA